MKKRNWIIGSVLLGIFLLIAVGGYVNKKYTMQKEKEVQLQKRIEEENTEKMEKASNNKIPSIIISNAKAKQGDKVTIGVSLVNNPGILGMTLNLSFDDTVLKLTGAEEGEAFEGILDMNHSKTLENGCVFLWDGENLTTDQIQDGEILKLEFEVLKNAPEGKTQVVLTKDEDGTVDQNLEVVDPIIENGFITITK
ncbi:cohesin domain protein [Roseburia sp. CAG:471]|nr:cohesin domain protein [Roseburia sp. CAG:471]